MQHGAPDDVASKEEHPSLGIYEHPRGNRLAAAARRRLLRLLLPIRRLLLARRLLLTLLLLLVLLASCLLVSCLRRRRVQLQLRSRTAACQPAAAALLQQLGAAIEGIHH